MKRTLTQILAGILIFGLLFGCSGTTQHDLTSDTHSPATAETANPTPEPTPDPAAMIAEAEIREGRHEREEGYPNPFKTHMLETDFIAVHMEDAIFEEPALREAAGTVAADLHTIEERVGETPEKVTVFLVQRMDRPMLINGHVICTTEDLNSGAYREALCGACYQLAVQWKQVGLCAFVFGTVDESGLSEYYADEAHALTASCAAVYLLPTVTDEETLDAARKTAQSITAYILETGGISALQSIASTAEVLPAWQEKLGIETPIVLPNGHEKADAMTTEDNRSFLCVIHMDNITIRVEKGSFAETAEEFYTFACKFWYGAGVEMETIRTEIPGVLDIAEERFAQPITIRFTQPGIINWTDGFTIYLVGDKAVWHELMHVMLIYGKNDQETYWLCEAIADYFSQDAASFAITMPDPAEEEDLFVPDAGREEALQIFLHHMWNVYRYLRTHESVIPEGLYDVKAINRAEGICCLLLGNPWGAGSTVGGARGYGYEGGPKETDGKGLSYTEATVLFKYRADTYGIETVVQGYLNGTPLSETYGKEYPELYQDCIAYITETYGSLLADTE